MRSTFRLPAVLVATLALAACADTESPTAADEPTELSGPLAPSIGAINDAAIPGQYIVVLKPGVDSRGAAEQLTRAHGGQVGHVYGAAIRGFSVSNLPDQAVAALARNPMVEYVEQDQVVTLSATAMLASGTQSNATWGLDRVDQRALPLDSKYSYNTSGVGVRAYIIDTGIRTGHSDFGGRAVSGYDAVDGGSADDCNGHGTHVAGTVGGTTWGVAKTASLVAVRVLDCNGSGTWSGVIAGVNWVTANHVKPAVANMSLGGGASTSVDDAVQGAIDAGVTMVVAAGNGDRIGRQQDACNYSPARVPAALTIGATTSSDSKTSWSNYGNCVDLFAPGASITSAWYQSDTQTNTISGTSMAAPHVAGAAALYLEANPNASPSAVASAITDASTKGIVTNSSTANNHLLYTLFGGGSTEPPANVAPTAAFTESCTDLTCSFTDTSTDSDGSITAWAWSFANDGASSDQDPTHTFSAAGTYPVSLTVTDDDGATASVSKNVTVTESTTEPPPSGGFTLSVSAYKVKGNKQADLTWSGSTSGPFRVLMDGSEVATGIAGSPWTHNLNSKGGGTATYVVCDSSGACSNPVTVTW